MSSVTTSYPVKHPTREDLPALHDRAAREDQCVEIRNGQRRLWDLAATGRQAGMAATPSTISMKLVSMGGVKTGMNVLDMACGAGDPTIDIARIVGRSGKALGLDISPAMVALATQTASVAGLVNATFRVIQDETNPKIEPESFDAITCRLGLMFMPDPLAALKAWTIALKPGHLISVCTHAALPSFETTMTIVERHVPELADSISWRRVLSLSSIRLLEGIFKDSGLTDIKIVRDHHSQIRGTTVSECWDTMLRRSPIYDGFQNLPPRVRREIRNSCIEALAVDSWRSNDAIFGGDVLFASGRRR